MKMKFKTKAKDDRFKTVIEVKIDTTPGTYTRWEALEKKRELQDRIHAVLRDFRYHTAEIKLG